MKIVVYTLGCKVSQYESDSIMEELKSLGYETSSKLENADIFIINTCAVTNEAERKSRGIIAKINKLNEKAKIIVCGCASQNNQEQFLSKQNVVLVLGTMNKNKIPLLLKEIGNITKELTKEYEEFNFFSSSRTRAYLKIQDGCNNFCSYCLIPYVRGRSRSRDLNNIIREAEKLSLTNKEIVLTGINMSDYRIDGELALTKVLSSLKNINSRVRIGSLEVNIINEEFLQTLKDMPNFCDQFHLSMQSGCNKILKLMNRHYTKEEFLEKVELIRKYFPNASITTDVIVGFPEESEEDFLETYNTCKNAQFFQMHIFPYSIRKGTRAEKMTQVESCLVKDRLNRLSNLNKQMHEEFLNQNIDKIHEVITEQLEENFVVGHTGNYIKVYLDKNTKIDELVVVKLLKIYKDGMIGVVEK